MRFLLRIVGTWFLGMTLILMVMDGTKSLAASTILMTSIGDIWMIVHMQSLELVETEIAKGWSEPIWEFALRPILTWPAWAVIGLPGLFLIVLGQKKTRR